MTCISGSIVIQFGVCSYLTYFADASHVPHFTCSGLLFYLPPSWSSRYSSCSSISVWCDRDKRGQGMWCYQSVAGRIILILSWLCLENTLLGLCHERRWQRTRSHVCAGVCVRVCVFRCVLARARVLRRHILNQCRNWCQISGTGVLTSACAN